MDNMGCRCSDKKVWGLSGICEKCGFLRWKTYDWNFENEYGCQAWLEAMNTHLELLSRNIVVSTVR